MGAGSIFGGAYLRNFTVCLLSSVLSLLFGSLKEDLRFAYLVLTEFSVRPTWRSRPFVVLAYRRIPKISPGAYIFQRPFLRGLFLEGLIFGGAYVRREICVSKSIRLTLQLEVNIPFLFCFTSYSKAIFQVQAPRGLILEGRFNGWFFALPVWGAYIWRGLYMEGLIFGILRYVVTNFLLAILSEECHKCCEVRN